MALKVRGRERCILTDAVELSVGTVRHPADRRVAMDSLNC